MSAAEALQAARAVGLTVRSDGDCLLLEADAEPPRAVLDALARHKPAILNLLRPGAFGWTADNWRAYFEDRCEAARNNERTRAEAEAVALACCVVNWLNHHPAPSPPGRCTCCGKTESPGAVLLPFGIEPGKHAWLHTQCWPAWHEARRIDAITALAAMGIVTRQE
jgi:hypothetical protein